MGLWFFEEEFLFSEHHADARARFRISIKDQQAGDSMKVELIDALGLWGERRYKIRLNGRPANQVPEATLSEVCQRLRRWLVRRAG